MAAKNEIWTVGRRKTSVARIKMTDGSGKIIVNKKEIKEYMSGSDARVNDALKPLVALEKKDKYDLKILVSGGGISGQIGAIRHALARALASKDDASHASLKKEGFLTRDSRMVERKKYGLHKARRGTQFSKR